MNYEIKKNCYSVNSKLNLERISAGEFLIEYLKKGIGNIHEILDERKELFELIALDHRIEGRIISKYHDSCTGDNLPILIENLFFMQMNNWKQYKVISNASEKLLKKISDFDTEFIALKGYNLFDISADPFSIRNMGDRDLIIRDTRHALTLFKKLGVEEYKEPAAHEELNLPFDDIWFDLHRFFPVWRLTGQAVNISDVLDSRNIIHNGNVEVSEVYYKDIKEYTKIRNIYGDATLSIPNAAMAAFIQITHFYRDVIRTNSVATRLRPRIRLQELYEIQDLTNSYDFNENVFLKLVYKYKIEDQTRIAGSFIYAITGDKTLLNILGVQSIIQSFDEKFTINVDLWHGFTFGVEVTLSELLFTKFTAPTLNLLLRRNDLNISTGEEVNLSLNDNRTIYHSNNEIIDWDFKIFIRDRLGYIDASITTNESVTYPLTAYIAIDDLYIQLNFGEEDIRRKHRVSEDINIINAEHSKNNNIDNLKLTFSIPKNWNKRETDSFIFSMGHVDFTGKTQTGLFIPGRII